MRDIPPFPRMLGLLGVSPQLVCLVALHAGPAEWYDTAREIGLVYAALAFSFLGGAWWGIAAGAPAAERRRALGWLWVASTLPTLIAFAALLPRPFGWEWPEPSLVMLGGALLMSPIVDARLGALAPRWWMRSRLPLSIALGAATLAIALA